MRFFACVRLGHGKRIVLTLGKRFVAGNDERPFGQRTDVAWLPDGTIFVTDGYIMNKGSVA